MGGWFVWSWKTRGWYWIDDEESADAAESTPEEKEEEDPAPQQLLRPASSSPPPFFMLKEDFRATPSCDPSDLITTYLSLGSISHPSRHETIAHLHALLSAPPASQSATCTSQRLNLIKICTRLMRNCCIPSHKCPPLSLAMLDAMLTKCITTKPAAAASSSSSSTLPHAISSSLQATAAFLIQATKYFYPTTHTYIDSTIVSSVVSVGVSLHTQIAKANLLREVDETITAYNHSKQFGTLTMVKAWMETVAVTCIVRHEANSANSVNSDGGTEGRRDLKLGNGFKIVAGGWGFDMEAGATLMIKGARGPWEDAVKVTAAGGEVRGKFEGNVVLWKYVGPPCPWFFAIIATGVSKPTMYTLLADQSRAHGDDVRLWPGCGALPDVHDESIAAFMNKAVTTESKDSTASADVSKSLTTSVFNFPLDMHVVATSLSFLSSDNVLQVRRDSKERRTQERAGLGVRPPQYALISHSSLSFTTASR